MKKVANLSGGGAAALGFNLGAVLHLEKEEGVNFDVYYGVSAGTCAAGLLSVFTPEQAYKNAVAIEDYYDANGVGSWIKSLLPWTPNQRAIANYDKAKKALHKIFKGRKVSEPVVFQFGNLYDMDTPVFIEFEPGDPAENMVDFIVTAMSIPGAFMPMEWNGKLLCDVGAIESSVADRHMPAGGTIWTIDVHNRINMTPESYAKASVLDMFGPVTASATFHMYQRDKAAIKKNYGHNTKLEFIEADADLEVLEMRPHTVRAAYLHGISKAMDYINERT